MNPTAFPLAWPAGKPRTPEKKRVRGQFSRKENKTRSYGDGTSYNYTETKYLTLSIAVDRALEELRRLGARRATISTNVVLRNDGFPRGGQKPPSDPGVAVYFTLDGDPVALATDRYDTVEANLAAIAAHIAASRAIKRHGVGTLREIFRGFTALPAATSPDDWRKLLDEPQTLAAAEATYREKMRTAHPDVGGSEAQAAALNAAITRARETLR